MVSYKHKLAHNQESGSEVCSISCFPAPDKLEGLKNSVYSSGQEGNRMVYNKNRVTPFVACNKEVIYKTPFSSGKIYVGQTAGASMIGYVSIVQLSVPHRLAIGLFFAPGVDAFLNSIAQRWDPVAINLHGSWFNPTKLF